MDTSCLSSYLQNIGGKPQLDKEEEHELARIIQEGGPESETAKHVMIEANLKLVVSIAKEHQQFGMDMEDLISEGNIGLIKAIEKFDPSLGCKLSTYACWWIHQHIHQAISNQSKTIRMPAHAIEKIRRVRTIIAGLTKELERPPTLQEISEETYIPTEKLEEILQWDNKPLSLNYTDDACETPLEQLLEDESAKNPFHELLQKSDAVWTNSLMDVLTERERKIIKRRFGFDTNEPSTLEEIGCELRVTRERIRQIESRALKKLRRWLGQLKTLSKT